MSKRARYGVVVIMMSLFIVACATTKTVHVWKDDAYTKRIESVLIIGIGQVEHIRSQFENVLANKLQERGIRAYAANKVIPGPSKKLDRETIAAKVKELGVETVLVSRSINQEEVSRQYSGGVYILPSTFYSGWYGFYDQSYSVVSVPGYAYDADYFTMLVNIYNVSDEKLVWSYLSRVKVEGSKQAAINPFVDQVFKKMIGSNLL